MSPVLKKNNMCERVSHFKALMRDWGYEIPAACMQLLDDASFELHAKQSCVLEFQRQLKAVKAQNKQLLHANEQLQTANKKMVTRLKEAYEHAHCLQAENAHLLERYNKQRMQLVKVCNANDELAVNSQVNQKALKMVLDCLSTEDAVDALTPEQRTELSRLTSESFSDQLRVEVRRELQNALKK